MTDTPNIAAADLVELTPDERDGFDLALDVARTTHGRDERAARAICTGLADLGRRRIRERAEGPVPTTLNAARDTLRRHVIAAVDEIDREAPVDPDYGDDRPHNLLTLAKAYVALGGDLADTPDAALEAEVRVRELEQAARAILDAVDDRTAALLYHDPASVLEPLGNAINALAAVVPPVYP